jgi:GAF domain-containing protein
MSDTWLHDATAKEIAALAALSVDEQSANDVLDRAVRLVARQVPTCTAAAATMTAADEAHTFATSDDRIRELHQIQIARGEGPVLDALHHGEPRRIDDVDQEIRWPSFTAAARAAGFAACLVLPVRTDERPGGALALYSDQTEAFSGVSHDLAVLIAAQAAVGLQNLELFADARRTINNLHAALTTQAWIEQAKAVIALEQGVSLEEAFRILSQESQRRRRKLTAVARDLVSSRLNRT